MNSFGVQPSVGVQPRRTLHIGKRSQGAICLARIRRRRVWIRLQVVLLLFGVYALLVGAQLAVRLGWFHGRKAKQGVRVEERRTLPAVHNRRQIVERRRFQ